jgi:hypothetical protein
MAIAISIIALLVSGCALYRAMCAPERITGHEGPEGQRGPIGHTGATGESGHDGADGLRGAPGKDAAKKR